jgi:hypothetical protein
MARCEACVRVRSLADVFAKHCAKHKLLASCWVEGWGVPRVQHARSNALAQGSSHEPASHNRCCCSSHNTPQTFSSRCLMTTDHLLLPPPPPPPPASSRSGVTARHTAAARCLLLPPSARTCSPATTASAQPSICCRCCCGALHMPAHPHTLSLTHARVCAAAARAARLPHRRPCKREPPPPHQRAWASLLLPLLLLTPTAVHPSGRHRQLPLPLLALAN